MALAQAENAQIYYEVHGSGYPVILVRGGGGNTLAWFQQVPFFSGKYRVITLDLRGFNIRSANLNYRTRNIIPMTCARSWR